MHTYIKSGDHYIIGHWQIGLKGHAEFCRLFAVSQFAVALRFINSMNGGEMFTYNNVEEIEGA